VRSDVLVRYPGRVYLIRGNHEFRLQNKTYGFFSKCDLALGMKVQEELFESVHLAFDWLPLAAVVGGIVLVMHGGIGDGRWRLDDLRRVKRPITDEGSNPLVYQVVWSDPVDGSELSVRAGHPSPRDRTGMLHSFSSEETQKFCKDNHLQLIVRSHQVVRNGFQIQHGGRLATVFSAPSYCGRGSNDSAIALITLDEDGNHYVKFKTFSNVEPRK